MKRPRSVVCLAISFCLTFLLSAPARAGLSGDIGEILGDDLLVKAQVGIDIVRLGSSADDSETIFQSNATAPLIPASNLKVITTSAALQRLGPDFRFRTQLIWHDGDLILIGDGDPTFGDAELLKKVGWQTDTVYKNWAAVLSGRGIHKFRDLIVDDSVFDDQFLHPNWPADQTEKRYVAEIGGLNLNANCVDVYVHPGAPGGLVSFTTDPISSYFSIRNSCISGGDNAIWLSRQPNSNDLILRGSTPVANDLPVSVTIHDPPMYAGTFLADVLKSSGITMTGTVLRDRTMRSAFIDSQKQSDARWIPLAVHETPLLSVIARANKDSMNLYAECICKRLGFAAAGEGSWNAGTAAVGQFLTSLHIPSDQFSLDDGCGLSKSNAISSHLMVAVLAHDFFMPSHDAWMKCLSVAGEDGTLLDRFRGTDLRGRIIGKTGFVNGVSCLSGYLHAKDDGWYCFSIMFNGIPEGTNSGAKTLQERIVAALDRHTAEDAQAKAN